MSTSVEQESRWAQERACFDALASERVVRAVSPAVVERYRNARGPWIIDHAFAVAGDLTGREVLDVGCGTGEETLILAALGARVTAVDISPKSLELLEKRAAVSGLADHIRTVCAPIETFEGYARYDLVWVNNLLHHVIPVLPAVLSVLAEAIAPGGRMIILEPVSPHWLRRLRMALPIPSVGTPGERPLERPEIRLIQQSFPDLRIRRFLLLSRVWPKTAVARADRLLLRVPGLELLGGGAVMWTSGGA